MAGCDRFRYKWVKTVTVGHLFVLGFNHYGHVLQIISVILRRTVSVKQVDTSRGCWSPCVRLVVVSCKKVCINQLILLVCSPKKISTLPPYSFLFFLFYRNLYIVLAKVFAVICVGKYSNLSNWVAVAHQEVKLFLLIIHHL